MTNGQIAFIVTLLCASVIILLVPCVFMIARRLIVRPSKTVVQKSGIGRVLAFSACLITSVWCLRYAVGYFMAINPEDPTQVLTWGEEIFNSIVHALQSFSMDEDYTQYIISGKLMMREIFGPDTILQNVYGIYASVLNFVAPVVGGAIIFEILASVFPRIKLHICHLIVWREKYYFSKLNEGSLVLAKSIWSETKSLLKKPVIIFCDAYIDSDDEKSTEMLQEARIIGAICVNDDIAHVRKNKLGVRKFFIIDENESTNLQTLTSLSGTFNYRYLKDAEIFLFTTDDAYIQVEKSVRDKLENDYGFTNDELPAFIPVDSYRNLVSNLLVDVPLFEPLIGREKNKDGTQDLNVTILGTGHIGTEMFLSTYWFGQILNCNLIINVLSQETEEEFWSKIDYVNPEIKHTTIKDDPILRINKKGDMSPVYCTVNYRQCDVKSSKFIELMTDEKNGILNTDYFLVSLGSDEDNISVANTVREYIGQYHLSEDTLDRTVVAYVVYNSELQDALNRKKRHCFFNDQTDVYTCAIGSYREVYSMRNVFMTDHDLTAQLMQEYYFNMQDSERKEKHKKRMKDDYKHWASLARAMHVKYKMFSLGVMDVSLLDYDNPADPEYVSHVKECLDTYKKTVAGEFCTDEASETEHINLLHRMAWLEHRRWNSFTRVKGFRYTGNYDAYVKFDENGKCISGSYKQMDIKLHPCLVECDAKGVRGVLTKDGKISGTFDPKYEEDLDLLDELSYDLYKKKYNDYDFKIYDYPNSDF
ncbi:MAG: hypothetical protein IJ039_02470 [Clostridia bacterium]|nr:hypothetical protein [Clostridia bacterium]